MVIAVEYVLPLDKSVGIKEQIARLRRFKNSLIGHHRRKSSALPLEHLRSLVSIVTEYPQCAGDLTEWELCILAADTLGIISNFNPPSAAAFPLLVAEAPRALLDRCTTLLHQDAVVALGSKVRYNILQALLRSTRIIWTNHARTVLPRSWGTDAIDACSNRLESLAAAASPEIRSMMQAAAKASGCSPEEWVASTFRSLIANMSAPLADERDQVGPTNLVQVLEYCAALDQPQDTEQPVMSAPARLSLAEDICLILSKTLRDPKDCVSLLRSTMTETGNLTLIRSLYRLAYCGIHQVQKAAILALIAIFAHTKRFLPLLPEFERILVCAEVDCGPLVEDLLQSHDAALRLVAADFAIVVHKQSSGTVQLISTQQTSALVPMLLAMLGPQFDPIHTAAASKTLTYLIVDHKDLQEHFVKLKGLTILRQLMVTVSNQIITRLVKQQDRSPSVDTAILEGCLLLIACLCIAQNDTFKQQVLAAGLLPHIVLALRGPTPTVKAAACHCIRGLGRSVNVLRTSLADSHAAEPLSDLLDPSQDPVVQITAAAAVSNLLLEFSPIRASLIAAGCVPHLCLQVHAQDHDLKLNALWALKNACYQSPTSFKREMMTSLGWNTLGDLIGGTDSDIAEQALGILRNITCTYGNDSLTGLAANQMGEDRMLELLEKRCEDGRALTLQALYTVANLATSSEAAKLAIAARTRLLIPIVRHLKSSNAEIRCAALWCIINLGHTEPSSVGFAGRSGGAGRRPREVVDKLRALEVEEELRRMTTDPDLDVRERVRDALGVFDQMYSPVTMV